MLANNSFKIYNDENLFDQLIKTDDIKSWVKIPATNIGAKDL